MKRPLVGAANRLRSDGLKQSDYFELLGLPHAFHLDDTVLQANWKQRAAQVHPDRFAAAIPAQRRVALEWSTRLNEAYRVLRDPLSRAQYMCEFAGFPPNSDGRVALKPAFLMQQMAWREDLEQLEASQDREGLKALIEEVCSDRSERLSQTARLIEQQQWEQAISSLNEWMFIEKFLQELELSMRSLAIAQ
jgi:molecular chaperone HscB